jgi:TolB-like protein
VPPVDRVNRLVRPASSLGYLLTKKFWLSKHATSEQTKIGATNVVAEKSIAVLPFVDLSDKHDQEYFADGMAEELLNLLVKVPDLRVIGRTSSFQFKGKADDLRRIGTALGAAYLVEGSVRRSADQVRVERAYQQRDIDLYFIKGDPLLKNLEGEPRYKAFLRKMNLPE